MLVDTSKAENGRVYAALSFKPTPRSHTTEVQTRSLWGVLLALVALVAALNRERVRAEFQSQTANPLNSLQTLRLIRRVSESSLFRGRQEEEDDGPVIRSASSDSDLDVLISFSHCLS